VLNTRGLNLYLVIIKIIPFISKDKILNTNSKSQYEIQVKVVREYRSMTECPAGTKQTKRLLSSVILSKKDARFVDISRLFPNSKGLR